MRFFALGFLVVVSVGSASCHSSSSEEDCIDLRDPKCCAGQLKDVHLLISDIFAKTADPFIELLNCTTTDLTTDLPFHLYYGMRQTSLVFYMATIKTVVEPCQQCTDYRPATEKLSAGVIDGICDAKKHFKKNKNVLKALHALEHNYKHRMAQVKFCRN